MLPQAPVATSVRDGAAIARGAQQFILHHAQSAAPQRCGGSLSGSNATRAGSKPASCAAMIADEPEIAREQRRAHVAGQLLRDSSSASRR